jgi:hypothetical protein
VVQRHLVENRLADRHLIDTPLDSFIIILCESNNLA